MSDTKIDPQLIETLKQNTTVFGELPPEQKATLIHIQEKEDASKIERYGSGNGPQDPWAYDNQELDDESTYRISPDYLLPEKKPEYRIEEWPVVRDKVNDKEYWLVQQTELVLVGLNFLKQLPDCIGVRYKYEDSDLHVEYTMYGELPYYDDAHSELEIKKFEGLTLKQVQANPIIPIAAIMRVEVVND
jgi:hypothetical protein